MSGNKMTAQKIEHHILSNPVSVTITQAGEDYIDSALRAVSALCRTDSPPGRVIILASKKAIEEEWLVHIRRDPALLTPSYIPALGKTKRKLSAFFTGRKVVLTNDEALAWTEGLPIQENDVLIIDELSRYRHFRSDRYKMVRKLVRKISRVIAFSRFPVPHGLTEIWEEIFLLDGGVRLGTSKPAFLDRYFFINRLWTNGHTKVYTTPKNNAAESISNAIRDICLDLTKESGAPGTSLKKRNVYLELSRSEFSRYRLMARELMLTFGRENKVSASDTSSATGKLLQLASGTVYDDEKEIIHFHNRKTDGLKRLIKEYEGRNILVAYWFRHELAHILSEVPYAHPISTPEDAEDWNRGRIRVGLVNSSTGGRPGDLSEGGNILIWFSLTWSLSLYTKANARISCSDRDSLIIHLIAAGTIDETVLRILDSNKKDNSLLLEAVRGITG